MKGSLDRADSKRNDWSVEEHAIGCHGVPDQVASSCAVFPAVMASELLAMARPALARVAARLR